MNRLRKEVNRLFQLRNIKYFLKKYYWEKLMFSKLWISKFEKFVTSSVFWRALCNANIIEFYNFLLQLKNQRYGGKTVWSFSFILILKGIVTI